MRRLTFGQLLDQRAAGFDLVRLILAWLVLVSHTWPLCAAVALIARRWSPRWTFTVAWAVTAAIALLMVKGEAFTAFVVEPYADKTMVSFALIFMTGALVAVWADRIRVFGLLAVVALVVGVWASHRSVIWADYGWGGGPWGFILICTLLTVACAAGSWFLVEQPAQRRWRPRSTPRPARADLSLG